MNEVEAKEVPNDNRLVQTYQSGKEWMMKKILNKRYFKATKKAGEAEY